MLKLIVGQESAADPVMPIRWCLTKQDLDKIAEKTDNPHILLVVTDSKNGEVSRQVVPLGAMMEYLRFGRSGKHRIQAAVVWGGSKKGIKHHFLNTSIHGTYLLDVVQSDGNLQENMDCDQFQRAELDVVIAEGFFAKEPSQLEKSWVNMFFRQPAVDQCHFRRRRIFAYTLQPALLLIFWVLKSWIATIITFASLLFHLPWETKDIVVEYWDNLRHPVSSDLADLLYEIKGSHSVVTKRNPANIKAKGSNRPSYMVIFHPAVISSFTVAALLIGTIAQDILWKKFSILGSMLLGVSIIAWICLVIVLVGLSLKHQEKSKWAKRDHAWAIREQKEREQEERDKRAKEERIAALRKELSILACDRAGAPSLKAIPADKRTVHLRFQDFKAKVCRPFAR